MSSFPSVIYVRSQDQDGNISGYVKAKFLTDKSGQFVINYGEEKFNIFIKNQDGTYSSHQTAKQQSGKVTPYIVPFDYDPNNTIAKFSGSLANLGTAATFELLFDSYARGGSSDLQRSYNGITNGDFVLAFKPSASFDFGLGCTSSGVSVVDCLSGGGAYNLYTKMGNWDIDISGLAFNSASNVGNILTGAAALANYRPTSITTKSWTPSTAPLTYADNQTVIIKNGDTLSKIEADQNDKLNPISADDLKKFNGLGPGAENNLQIGQRIIIPRKINGELVITDGNVTYSMNPTNGAFQYRVDDPQADTQTVITRSLDSNQPSGYRDDYVTVNKSSGALLDSRTSAVDSSYGYQFNNGQPTTSPITITTNPNLLPTQTGAADETWGGLLVGGGGYSVIAQDATALNYGQIINGVTDNTASVAQYQTASGGMDPGSHSVSTAILADNLANNFFANPDLANSVVWNPEIKAAALQQLDTRAQNARPTDPLVLDLNGDGVKLTDWLTDPVLFDADHDGGSKEQSGWVSKEDGLVVMDLNSNGVIDGIHETLSEYFNGAVGTGGNAGTKPYAHGLAALKSLDSNNDNQFTSADAAWNNVKVWVDANHDAVTDTGELKTLTSLGITAINLTPTSQSGLVNGGNEILASSTFVINSQTREVQAANFLTNPLGQNSAASGNGFLVTREGDASTPASATYVSTATVGETIDLTAKGAQNAIGGSADDTLTGTAEANWLAGSQGSDTFSAGAGNDVLLIDAADLQQNIHGGDGNDLVQVIGHWGQSHLTF